MAQLVKSDGTIIDVEPNNDSDFTLKELQEFVGGLIEIYHLKHTRIIVMNEEGRIHNLPENPKATEIMQKDFEQEILPVLGDVLFCERHQVK
jgi:hypothetical protein